MDEVTPREPGRMSVEIHELRSALFADDVHVRNLCRARLGMEIDRALAGSDE